MVRKQLMPWELEALHLLAQGHPRGEVAKLHGKSAATLGKLLREPLAQRELRRIHEKNLSTIAEMQTALQVYAPKAIAGIIADMENPNPVIAFKAKCWVAEAAGHTPTRRLEVKRVNAAEEAEYGNLSVEELRARVLENIKAAAIEVEAVALPAPEDLN